MDRILVRLDRWRIFLLICLSSGAISCAPVVRTSSSPAPVTMSTKENEAANSAPFGSLPMDEEVIARRSQAAAAPLVPIPPTALSSDGPPLEQRCHFTRLSLEAPIKREVRILLQPVKGSVRADGFAVDALFVEGAAPEEAAKLPFWRDRNGQLIATLKLPEKKDAPANNEQPGMREEFVVCRWLPGMQAILCEWQRAVGPHPGPNFANFPLAQLTVRSDIYAAYLRATAYMLCQSAF